MCISIAITVRNPFPHRGILRRGCSPATDGRPYRRVIGSSRPHPHESIPRADPARWLQRPSHVSDSYATPDPSVHSELVRGPSRRWPIPSAHPPSHWTAQLRRVGPAVRLRQPGTLRSSDRAIPSPRYASTHPPTATGSGPHLGPAARNHRAAEPEPEPEPERQRRPGSPSPLAV